MMEHKKLKFILFEIIIYNISIKISSYHYSNEHTTLY